MVRGGRAALVALSDPIWQSCIAMVSKQPAPVTNTRPAVSVIINTLNEANNIANCVESVRWADEIIVVDMMSDDQTAVLAKELGCEVYQHQRMGYVEPAREFAVSQACHDWVLILDADERCSAELARWIRQDLDGERFSGVAIPRRNYLKGEWVRCCGWYPDKQLRLLNRRLSVFPTEIHKAPRVSGPVLELAGSSKACLQHFAVFSMQERLSKLVRYSEISATHLHEQSKKCPAPVLLGRVVWSFLSAYFLRGGVFHGSLGLVLSLERANATFMKYVLLWDKNRTSVSIPSVLNRS